MQLKHSFEAADGTEIKMEILAEGGRDGIGAYEFHGQRCYDHGNWIWEDFTLESVDKPEYLTEANAWIDAHLDELREAADKEAESQAEHYAEQRGESEKEY